MAVAQFACHPALVQPNRSPLEDPLFSFKASVDTLPTPGSVPDALQERIRALRARVRETYCSQLMLCLRAIVSTCRALSVDVLVLPEYSVPWQVLDELAAVCGDLVLVAGTHTVTREAKRSGVYERLGALDVPLNEAVSPVLHRGKFLALQPKLNPAKPEAATLQPGARWDSIALPSPLPSPLGVLICLDFLVDPGFEPEAVTRDKLAACRLLAVPSWTPTKTLDEFRGRAWVRSERHRTPVLYANVADEGGSTIFAEDDAVHDLLRFPEHIGALGRGEEGLVVADLDLSTVRPGHATPYGWRPPVHPVALASLVYRAHPVAEEYVQWLDAQAPLLARDDDAACDALVDAVTRDKLVLQRVAMLHGADARARRLRRLVGDADRLGRVEDVRRLVREVVLPEEAVPFAMMRAAMAKGAAEAMLGWMGERELRVHQQMIAGLRDRLDEGAKALEAMERDEWTDAGLRAVGDVTCAVQGESRTRESEPGAERVESPSLPPNMDPAAMPDFTDGQLRVVFRRSVDDVRSILDRLPVRDTPLPDGRVRSDYEPLRYESLDYRARQLLLLLQAEGVAPLAVVGMAPLDYSFFGVIAIVSTHGELWRLYAIAEDTNQSDWHSKLLPEVLARAGARSVDLIRVTADELERRARSLLPIIAKAREEIVRIRQERLREVEQRYVDPDVRIGERQGLARELLDAWVREARTHVALVLGAFGSGKSTALADWCLHRWRDEPDQPFPVLVSLAGTGESADPIRMLITAARLEDTVAHQSAIRLLTTLGYLLPCFDGFDEMATRLQPAALAGRLAALTGILRDGGRIVVSSRSHYFPTEDTLRETERALAEALRQSGPHTRIEVLPFTDEKVARLVREVVGDDAAPAVLRRIETTYDLRDLASRPLLLAMVLRTLERIPEGRRITQAVLYDEYLERWLEQTDVGDRDCFTHDQKRAFAESLAETLWRSGHTAVGWTTLRDSVRAQLFRELPDDVPPGAALLEIAGGAFFVRDGEDQFRFAHKSFLEYFLARALVQALSRGRVDVLDTRPLTREVIDFVHEVIVRDEPTDPQHHRAIDALARWLRIGRSAERTPTATAVTAANALRLLHGLARASAQGGWVPESSDLRAVALHGEDFEGLVAPRAQLQQVDLRGCRLARAMLDGCDLTHARLDGAVFDDATLREATLRGASLCMVEAKACDLRGADLRGADLAQSVWVDTRWDGARREATGGCAAIWVGGSGAPQGDGLILEATLRSGHSGSVTSVSWSPDGTRVASGSDDKTVRVWDVSRGELVATLQGHDETVTSVAWSPDGTRLASGSVDETVLVWDVSRGAIVGNLLGHGREVTSVSWSPDGTRVASGSYDQTIRVWDVSRGEVVAILEGNDEQVDSVSWSPDGTRVASGSWDNSVRVWELSCGEVVATLLGHDNSVSSVSWSPDGTHVASGSWDQTVRVWNVSRGEVVATLHGHYHQVTSVSWSPDGTLVASGSVDETVRVWDVSRGEIVATLQGHNETVTSVSWSPDGKRVASGSDDRTVCVWDVSSGEVMDTFQGHVDVNNSVSWSPSGTQVASASSEKKIRVWDVSHGEVVATLQGHAYSVSGVSWSPDGLHVASGSRDKTVRMWHVSRSEAAAILHWHDSEVTSVSWSYDGTHIASGSRDRTVRVWNVFRGEVVAILQGHNEVVTSVSWSPDGTHIASGSYDTTVRVWDVSRSEAMTTLQGHTNQVTSVSWSPDGTLVASGSRDHTVRVWNVSHGEVVATLQGHTNRVTSVSWSPDGTRVASGSRDHTVRVWDVSRGEVVATLQGHEEQVTSVSWSPDGTRVASGSADGTVRIYGAPVSERTAWRPLLALYALGDAALAAIPSGYVVAHDTANTPLRLGVRAPTPSRAILFTPPGALRTVFHQPDLIANFLRGETLGSTPDDDLRALGWNPGPLWAGGPVILHDAPVVDAVPQLIGVDVPVDVTTFVPGRALTGLDDLPGRAELVDSVLALCAVRNPQVVRGPRRVGKTSLLHTLVRRLAPTHDVHLCTLEGGIASRHDLARRMLPALSDAPQPADALLRHAFARDVVFLVDELGWLTRLPPEDLAWLRGVAQHVGTVLLAGSHQDWTDAVRHARKVPGSSFGNDFVTLDLGPLTAHDAVSFLTSHGSADAPITDAVARWIVDLCGPWAFYLQVMGFWVQQEIRAGRPPVSREQVRAIRHDRLLIGCDVAFGGRWEELPPLVRSTLLDHRDGHFPRLDDLAQPTQEALLGAGICSERGLWLQDEPFYDWIRLHAKRLAAALRNDAN